MSRLRQGYGGQGHLRQGSGGQGQLRRGSGGRGRALALVATALAAAAVFAEGSSTPPRFISAPDLASRIMRRDPALRIFDLRSTAEFERFHVASARQLSPSTLRREPLSPGATVVLYGNGEARAARAWAIARERGADAFVLRGGVREWFVRVYEPRLASGRDPDRARRVRAGGALQPVLRRQAAGGRDERPVARGGNHPAARMLMRAALDAGALRMREFARLDAGRLVYLDYTGAALYPASLVRRDARRLATRVLGNPHSESAPSSASTDALDEARRLTLRLLDADPGEYDVAFTANATAAIRILAEAFPFTRGSRLVLSADNHNSVNGLRVAASRRRASIEYVRLDDDLRPVDPMPWLPRASQPSLFAYPAQSNFSGVRHQPRVGG